MTKHTPINGWTKETMIAQLDKYLPAVGRCVSDAAVPSCLFHRPLDNSRCAAGAFLPGDPTQEPWFRETATIGLLLWYYPKLSASMPLAYDAMYKLQRAHDSSEDVEPRESVFKWIEENVA